MSVWKDDEVERIIEVTIEYKVAMTSENVDWKPCQTKCSANILDLFVAHYLSPEEIISTVGFARAFGILVYFIAAY